MAGVGYKQDMPPAGGYRPMDWKRVPGRSYLGGIASFAIFGVVTTGAWMLYYKGKRSIWGREIEQRSAKLAIEPLLTAERDRMYLKHVRKLRDEEEKLMADVPGWQVGKLYDEPIFKTVGDDFWWDPQMNEFYLHNDLQHFKKRSYIHWIL
ncbi:unnamed protein product [Notodromas monacha]|uniref:NADH dehydrogenase [ubiquinone] 1 alpha subcomplex subunit 13 n=1 Tax=Notodromas monacha TaxID=399045 RepID=A0A7R9BGC0_9CRUS|nr:unnamed protein product [Notodromas monacha]CAG0914940.1 unnamed protein product [Notodromas monacha]